MNPNFIPSLKPLFVPSPVQTNSINTLFASIAKHGISMLEQQAYIFATAYHEAKLRPVREGFSANDAEAIAYVTKLFNDHVISHNYALPDPATKQSYYGRAFVQITHKANYKTFGDLLHIDLVGHPEKALDTTTAAEIAVIGMKGGMFTGVGLSKYFNDKVIDPINARRIINGTDKAELIKNYYDLFLKALKS